MKDYMNENEVYTFIRVYGAESACKDMVEDWGGRGNLTKDEGKWLKTAVTNVRKVLASIEGRMDRTQLTKVVRTAKMELERRPEYAIGRDDLDNIVESVLFAACSPCKCGHSKDCSARNFFKRFEVPPFDRKAKGDGRCPWEQRIEVKEVDPLPMENVAQLPVFPGDRVKVLKDGRWINSYVDHIIQDRKRRWKLHVKATDEYYAPDEFGEVLQEVEG